MDEALRRAERGAGWEGRARALRRAGQEPLARCWVSAAARAGLVYAREVLEAEYPLDRDAEALLRILREAPADAWGVEAPRAAEILLGDGDPRLSGPAAAWFEARAEASQGDLAVLMVRNGLRQDLVRADHLTRIAIMVREGGLGLDRSLLLPHELRELAADLLSDPLSAAARLRLAALLRRAGEPALEGLLARVLEGASEVKDQALIASVERGRAGGSLPSGLDWRPEWASGVHREELTLSHARGTLRPWGRSPVGIELPEARWVALLDLDGTKSINDRHGHHLGDEVLARVAWVLREVVGDRVLRFAGDEWLIPWEGAQGLERLEACVRAVREDEALQDLCGGVTVSAGVSARSGASAKDLQRADEAQLEAKRAGRDRLVVAPSLTNA